MASDNLNIPHTHEGNPSFSLSLPSPSLDSPCFEQRPNNPPNWRSLSPKDSHANLNGHLSSPIPVLRLARNSPDVSGTLSHASDNSSPLPHPSPTHSALDSARGESRDTDTGSVTTRNDVLKGDIVDQSTVLDNLEGRLEAAKKLHGESVELQTLYESGTVATIKDLRRTGKQVPCYLQRQSPEIFSGLLRPLPQDNALFNEVDMLLVDIRQLYDELNMFWKEEIRQVAEFLKKGRSSPRYLERWNKFRSSLEQAIESWKVCFLHLYYAFPSRLKLPWLELATN